MSDDKPLEIIKLELAKLELKPGDILVFQHPDPLTAKAREAIGALEYIRRFMPPGVQVMFIPNDIKISVVRQGELKV